jgi:hypothetical protein
MLQANSYCLLADDDCTFWGTFCQLYPECLCHHAAGSFADVPCQMSDVEESVAEEAAF